MRTLPRVLLWVVIGGAVACSASSPPKTPARNWTEAPAVVSLTGTSEIIVVGDLHGDSLVAARILSAAGLITASTPFHWIGGSRVLVITGDVIDKGTTALAIIDLLSTLEAEARAAGGQVIVTLGNHEAEFLADPTDTKSADFQGELIRRGLEPKKVAAGETMYGTWLLNRPIAALIDGWFFCHAGQSGGLSADSIAQVFRQRFEKAGVGGKDNVFDDPFVTGTESLLEAQVWWRKTGGSGAQVAEANLAALPAEHIVFGHDPGDLDFSDDPQGNRKRGDMVSRYDGRLFLIDVGMSAAVGYSDGAALRIVRGPPDQATAVFTDGTSKVLWP